jgi:hypothetical protein
MIQLRDQARISALLLAIVVVLTFTAVLDVGHVYGQTLVLTPNPVQQGVDVQVTGSGFQQYENAQIEVYSYVTGTCASIPLMNFSANTDVNGNLQSITIPTSGLAAGTYCVEGNGFLDPPNTVNLVVIATTGATTATGTSMTQYAYALPLVVILIFVAYAVIGRRNREADSY